MTYDDEWLQGRCGYWQEVLRIQDWRIACFFVEPHLLDASKWNNARVTMDRDSRHARVWVKHPDRIDPVIDVIPSLDPISHDPEVLLVHELLHVSLDDMDIEVPSDVDVEGSAYRMGQERHIINLSKALVSLDRKGRSNGPREVGVSSAS